MYILRIDFTVGGAWDVPIKKVLNSGRKKVNQLLVKRHCLD